MSLISVLPKSSNLTALYNLIIFRPQYSIPKEKIMLCKEKIRKQAGMVFTPPYCYYYYYYYHHYYYYKYYYY